MKQKVLVTGSAGFIGRVVVARLLADDYRVLAMLRPGTVPPFIPHQNLRLLYADITDYASFANRVKGVEAVVHLAANKYHPKLSYEVNLKGAENLVRLGREKRIKGKRVINISSQSTKIRFRGVYGESKRLSDEILQVPELEWTTFKPSLVYGTGKETLFATIKNYVEKLPVVPMIGNGKWRLHPIDVEDLAGYISLALTNDKTIRQVYDLGDPKELTFDQLIGHIQKELGTDKPILHVPTILGLPAVYAVTKIIPSLPITIDNVLGSIQSTSCNPLPAIRALGLKPLTTKRGVSKYLGKKKDTRQRVAVVGLGKMGILHASILNIMPEARIVAIVDMDESLGNTAKSMGIKANFYPSLEEAIQNETIDAVYICTPTFAHKEVILKCEKHKLPYFVEKPIFPDYHDFRGVKVSNKNMAGYFWIYKREVEYVKTLLQRRVIGELTAYKVDLRHSEVFGPKKGWMFRKELSGGGVLANPGPHALSLIYHLFGRATVEKAKMRYLYGNEVEDKATVWLKHPSGLAGQLTANWSVKGYPVMAIEFEITGTKGSIKYKKETLTIKVGKKKQSLPYSRIPTTRIVFNLNPRSGGDAYYSESKEFVQSLTGKHKFVSDVRFAKQVEQMIGEAYAKAKE